MAGPWKIPSACYGMGVERAVQIAMEDLERWVNERWPTPEPAQPPPITLARMKELLAARPGVQLPPIIGEAMHRKAAAAEALLPIADELEKGMRQLGITEMAGLKLREEGEAPKRSWFRDWPAD